MCEVFGNECFRKIIDTRNDYEDEDNDSSPCLKECLPDCEPVEFTVVMSKRDSLRHYTNTFCSDEEKQPSGISQEERTLFCGYLNEKLAPNGSVIKEMLNMSRNFALDRSMSFYIFFEYS